MLILFGLAGSGKGTQGKALSEIFGWKWLSVGQVLRDVKKYEKLVNTGKLVPDEEVIELMGKYMKKAEAEGFEVILDGYPRNVRQAEWVLENMLERIDGVIMLDVPKEELLKRLELRGRKDDKDEASIKWRFEVFEQNICSILSLLEAKKVPIQYVDGVGTVEEVTKRLVKIVKKMMPKATEQTEDVNGGEIEKSYGE